MSSFLHNGDISDPFRSFISKSRYARWIDEYGRRETWEETVDRYVNYMASKVDMSEEDKVTVRNSILNHEVMPSMRAMMTAGEAAERSNVAAYNCSFLAVDHPRAFDEALFILMNGTGLGYSCEKRYVRYLPEVPAEITEIDDVIVVEDSKEGWAMAYRRLIDHLYNGHLPRWDLRQLRPKGARLKTFGGRSSGPEPLNDLFEFTVKSFAGARGRKLSTIEVHDIMCMIGSIVVVGGVRRSALISLGSLDDSDHRDAKSGEWWVKNGQRALSNNSAVYNSKPTRKQFDEEWAALAGSGSGERGIFNLAGAKAHIPERRDASRVAGTNPCGEILLRNMGFCNLSEVIVSPEDTLDDLKRKVSIASKIGTWQSTLINFPYLRPEWRENAKEERLLGVSLTGQMGHTVLNGSEGKKKLESWLKDLRHVAVMANKKEARRLGINQSASVTTVKPSGCRPGDALTTTKQGIYTLDELLSEHSVDAEWSDVEGIVASNGDRISKTYRNGVAEVAKVSLSHGYELESTWNHQWYVSKYHNGHKYVESFEPGWVRTDELLPGHVIETNVGSYSSTSESVLLDDFPRYHNVETRNVPSVMNPELGWLIGYLWGDGSMSHHKKRLRFTDESMDNLVRAQGVLLDQFGYGGNIYKSSGDRNCHSLEVASAEIFDFFVHNGVWKYGDGRMNNIPLVVRESSYETGLAFIAGLIDSDGCVYEKQGRRAIAISTSDEQFAEHIQQVALALGVSMGRSHNTKGQNKQESKSMWLLSFNGESDEDRFNLMVSHSSKARNVLSELEWAHTDPNRRRFVFGKVKSVDYSRTVETFDVEVESSHWYEAGAFKSHNTVSTLTNTSSGMHAWHDEFYIRRVRSSKMDPIGQFLIDSGVPAEEDVMNTDNLVFSFPFKAPEGALTRSDMTAIDQLEVWLSYKTHYTEHNPSVTISVREEEWDEVGDWVFEHFDEITGVSFLPHSDHTYRQAPFESINEEGYEALKAQMPPVLEWERLPLYEFEDGVDASQQLACTAGECSVVDLIK